MWLFWVLIDHRLFPHSPSLSLSVSPSNQRDNTTERSRRSQGARDSGALDTLDRRRYVCSRDPRARGCSRGRETSSKRCVSFIDFCSGTGSAVARCPEHLFLSPVVCRRRRCGWCFVGFLCRRLLEGALCTEKCCCQRKHHPAARFFFSFLCRGKIK